jgi:hypothetical protein
MCGHPEPTHAHLLECSGAECDSVNAIKKDVLQQECWACRLPKRDGERSGSGDEDKEKGKERNSERQIVDERPGQ